MSRHLSVSTHTPKLLMAVTIRTFDSVSRNVMLLCHFPVWFDYREHFMCVFFYPLLFNFIWNENPAHTNEHISCALIRISYLIIIIITTRQHHAQSHFESVTIVKCCAIAIKSVDKLLNLLFGFYVMDYLLISEAVKPAKWFS